MVTIASNPFAVPSDSPLVLALRATINYVETHNSISLSDAGTRPRFQDWAKMHFIWPAGARVDDIEHWFWLHMSFLTKSGVFEKKRNRLFLHRGFDVAERQAELVDCWLNHVPHLHMSAFVKGGADNPMNWHDIYQTLRLIPDGGMLCRDLEALIERKHPEVIFPWCEVFHPLRWLGVLTVDCVDDDRGNDIYMHGNL